MDVQMATAPSMDVREWVRSRSHLKGRVPESTVLHLHQQPVIMNSSFSSLWPVFFKLSSRQCNRWVHVSENTVPNTTCLNTAASVDRFHHRRQQGLQGGLLSVVNITVKQHSPGSEYTVVKNSCQKRSQWSPCWCYRGYKVMSGCWQLMWLY